MGEEGADVEVVRRVLPGQVRTQIRRFRTGERAGLTFFFPTLPFFPSVPPHVRLLSVQPDQGERYTSLDVVHADLPSDFR
jgi:hypothetical protein